jgi:hypothetical protein
MRRAAGRQTRPIPPSAMSSRIRNLWQRAPAPNSSSPGCAGGARRVTAPASPSARSRRPCHALPAWAAPASGAARDAHHQRRASRLRATSQVSRLRPPGAFPGPSGGPPPTAGGISGTLRRPPTHRRGHFQEPGPTCRRPRRPRPGPCPRLFLPRLPRPPRPCRSVSRGAPVPSARRSRATGSGSLPSRATRRLDIT